MLNGNEGFCYIREILLSVGCHVSKNAMLAKMLMHVMLSNPPWVLQVWVKDAGSHPRLAPLNIEGVQALGIVDSGADITIMNGDLFKEVAATVRLW